MTRRSLSIVVLAVASLVLAACSQTTAPRSDTTVSSCLGGYIVSGTLVCPQ